MKAIITISIAATFAFATSASAAVISWGAAQDTPALTDVLTSPPVTVEAVVIGNAGDRARGGGDQAPTRCSPEAD